MPRNKGISTIRATKCRTVEIPFLLSRKQIYRSVWRGLRIQICFREVENIEVTVWLCLWKWVRARRSRPSVPQCLPMQNFSSTMILLVFSFFNNFPRGSQNSSWDDCRQGRPPVLSHRSQCDRSCGTPIP